jgi:hypothetical protein
MMVTSGVKLASQALVPVDTSMHSLSWRLYPGNGRLAPGSVITA